MDSVLGMGVKGTLGLTVRINRVGSAVGLAELTPVGSSVGLMLGPALGLTVGLTEGDSVGELVGDFVGSLVGLEGRVTVEGGTVGCVVVGI